MFQLDDKFLQDVGLGEMPENEKEAFLKVIYSELELRVGEALSAGMSNEQLGQFEAFVDAGDSTKALEERQGAINQVVRWFEKYLPNYRESAEYQQLNKSALDFYATRPEQGGYDEALVMSEYGSLKWLEMNRPDYKQVVAAELGKLKGEITQNKDSLLG